MRSLRIWRRRSRGTARNEALLEKLAATRPGRGWQSPHTPQNKKMLVRDRIARLVDGEDSSSERSFLELSQLCGLGGSKATGVTCSAAVQYEELVECKAVMS